MQNEYHIKTIVMGSGERFPMIVNQNGKPDFSTTVYSVSMLRARNLASATIENSLRAILILKLFLDGHGIVLKNRFNEGVVLHLHELNSLVRICRLHTKDIPAFFNGVFQVGAGKPKPLSLESYRRNTKESAPEVSRALIGTRLMFIRKYLSWRVDVHIPHMNIDDPRREALLSARDGLARTIRALAPRVDRRGDHHAREGLAHGVWEKILQVVDPSSPDNPWCDEFVRVRNEFMLILLYHLGIRRGELLNLRVDDFETGGDRVTIKRRADDPSDPRRKQPKVKTKARELRQISVLQEKTENYIYHYRSCIPKAKKHFFLFVSKEGTPLSIDGLHKIFSVLRTKCPDVPPDFTTHVLRHTWNDNFSEYMDESNIGEEMEKKLRAQQMGWKETSSSADAYTRRHTRKKAQEASLNMQEKY